MKGPQNYVTSTQNVGYATDVKVEQVTALVDELSGKLNGVSMGLSEALGEIGATIDRMVGPAPEPNENDVVGRDLRYYGGSSIGKLFELADALEGHVAAAHRLKVKLQRIA